MFSKNIALTARVKAPTRCWVPWFTDYSSITNKLVSHSQTSDWVLCKKWMTSIFCARCSLKAFGSSYGPSTNHHIYLVQRPVQWCQKRIPFLFLMAMASNILHPMIQTTVKRVPCNELHNKYSMCVPYHYIGGGLLLRGLQESLIGFIVFIVADQNTI